MGRAGERSADFKGEPTSVNGYGPAYGSDPQAAHATPVASALPLNAASSVAGRERQGAGLIAPPIGLPGRTRNTSPTSGAPRGLERVTYARIRYPPWSEPQRPRPYRPGCSGRRARQGAAGLRRRLGRATGGGLHARHPAAHPGRPRGAAAGDSAEGHPRPDDCPEPAGTSRQVAFRENECFGRMPERFRRAGWAAGKRAT